MNENTHRVYRFAPEVEKRLEELVNGRQIVARFHDGDTIRIILDDRTTVILTER